MSRWTDFVEVMAHKRAFLQVRRGNSVLRANVSFTRALLHDTGKALNVLLLGDRLATAVHRRVAGHHNFRCQADLWEALVDWECARFTKPSKPLNARQTWLKYYADLYCGNLLNLAEL
jgi:hypothetical protein